MQVPLFLEALPLLDPVAVAWADELVDEDLIVVVDKTELVETSEVVVLCTDELEEDGDTELVTRAELAECAEVIVLSADELSEADVLKEGAVTELVGDGTLVERVELVNLVELSAVVTAGLPEEASVDELVRLRLVLCETWPVPTGLTYTVSVSDA